MKCGLHVYGNLVGMTPIEIEKRFEVTLEADDWDGMVRSFRCKDSILGEHDYIQIIGELGNIRKVLDYMSKQ